MGEGFDSLVFKVEKSLDGVRARFSFPNGYGVSVVRHKYSYGNQKGEGFYEVAVLDGEDLTYDTPVTNDVLGWQTPEDVSKVMAQVEALPPKATFKSIPGGTLELK